MLRRRVRMIYLSPDYPGVQMIGKPFSFDELGARIRASLDGLPE